MRDGCGPSNSIGEPLPKDRGEGKRTAARWASGLRDARNGTEPAVQPKLGDPTLTHAPPTGPRHAEKFYKFFKRAEKHLLVKCQATAMPAVRSWVMP